MERRTPSRQKNAVTLQDIADRCGLDKSTVGYALRGKRSTLSAATIARVEAVAREMGYNQHFHDSARRLAMRRNGETYINRLVSIFFPYRYLRHNFFSLALQGASEVLENANFAVCIGHTTPAHTRDELVLPFPHLFDRGDLDGIIVSENIDYFHEIYPRLRANPGFGDRPIVVLFRPQPGCSSVGVDYRHGAYLAARHLLELGHRDMAMVVYGLYYAQDQNELQPPDRIAGVRQAYREFGLDPDVHLHCIPMTSTWLTPPSALADQQRADKLVDEIVRQDDVFIPYLRAHPEVTAVLALNDAYAIYAWYALQQAGLSVPDDISLVGFDDTDPFLDSAGHNILTTVRLPLIEIGAQAADLLVKRIAGSVPEDTDIVLPTELIVRGSTAPARR